jgi:hypothetical protein
MSATKRVLFGGGLQSEPFKSEWGAKLDELQSRLNVRIPTRRTNPLYGRRWDPNWPSCLSRSARDLGIEAVNINDEMFVATDADAERVKERAQELWERFAERLRKARNKIEF